MKQKLSYLVIFIVFTIVLCGLSTSCSDSIEGIDTYNISYNLDEGTNDESNPTTYTIDTATITLENPNRSGYYFDGWYTNDGFIGSSVITELTNGSTGNITLYAKWIANTSVDSFTFTVINTNEIEIKKFTGPETEVVIPDTIVDPVTSIRGPVTSIGYAAFNDCSTPPKTVIIPNSVISIGQFAFFNCSLLTSVTIPNLVTSIGPNAFANCSALTSVTIPDLVTSIGYSAFSGCSIVNPVDIGNSVTNIGTDAFRDCSSLTSVTIPNSVTDIGLNAFYTCTDLITINCEATSKPSGWNKNWCDHPFDLNIVHWFGTW